MNKLFPILLIILIALPAVGRGQHFIGLHKSEVRELMKKTNRELYEDDSSTNKLFNMLKYVDRLGSQTLIYFFSGQDTCLYSKWICDYSMMNRVVAGLNEKYNQSADDSWHYTHEGRKFRISLETEEWYFTITTKPEDTDKE